MLRWSKVTMALSIVAILAASVSAYTAYRVYAVTQYQFPQGQTFSIGVSYSFASSTSNNLLLPGSNGIVTLSITSGLKTPSALTLSYNATQPALFGWNGNKPGFFCDPGPSTQQMQMYLAGQVFLPSNANLAFLNGCGGVPQSVGVTVNPGVNTFNATLTVLPTATLATVFSISWTATA